MVLRDGTDECRALVYPTQKAYNFAKGRQVGCIGCVLDNYYICTCYRALGYSYNLRWLRLLALFGNLWVLLVLVMLAHGSLALATSPSYNDGVSAFYTSLALPTLLC